jgi:photosystem II stability/assembly factor-like uncharacterized protein
MTRRRRRAQREVCRPDLGAFVGAPDGTVLGATNGTRNGTTYGTVQGSDPQRAYPHPRRSWRNAAHCASHVPAGALEGPRRALAAVLAAFVLGLACLVAGAAPARAADLPVWAPVATPNGASWAVHDVAAFGKTGLALAGDGHVAVSKDAGHTWKVVVPRGYGSTAFTAVAFSSTGHGVIASGGLLLVSADWGATWAPPAYAGAGPSAAVADVAARGTRAVAVGGGGMIFASADSGVTWQGEASPVADALSCVALAGDGSAVAGTAAGDVLVRTTSWAVAGSAGAPVTGVAAAPTPAWGDGQPDLFATTGSDVLGSDDGATFASLPGLPDLSSGSWPAVVWAGQPDRALLLAGAPQAGFFGSAGAWVSAGTGLDGLVAASAPGGQSAAYLLDAGGVLVRTLSAGRTPATAALSRSRVVTGSGTRLSATVRVAAPGTVSLRSRIPGRSWTTERAVAWTASNWQRALSFSLAPSLSHDYRLDFKYGGTVTQLTPVLQVTVVPRVTAARKRYDLRVGSVFRFSGSVSPQLSGERVELLTDRGGGWRPVSLQPSVRLSSGRTWTSRKFGTPKAETYHLRAHLARTARHAEAWSAIVTVAIR